MKLLQYVLYGLIAFFFFRMVRTIFRLLSNSRRDREGQEPLTGEPPKKQVDKPFREAQDAHFEDLPGEARKEPPPASKA